MIPSISAPIRPNIFAVPVFDVYPYGMKVHVWWMRQKDSNRGMRIISGRPYKNEFDTIKRGKEKKGMVEKDSEEKVKVSGLLSWKTQQIEDYWHQSFPTTLKVQRCC